MAYRDASRRPGDLAAAQAASTPKPPLTKASYWACYFLLTVLPLVISVLLFEGAVMSTGPGGTVQGPVFFVAIACFAWGALSLAALRIWGHVGGKRWAVSNNAAVRLIGEGRAGEALAMLDPILAQSRAFPVAYSLYLWNRGIALVRLGRFAEARAAIAPVHAHGWLERPRFNQFVPAVMASMGNLETLEGNLDAAEQWRRSAHARLASSSSVAALPLDVMLAARRGEFDRAETLCEAQWTAAEAALTARDVKLLRVLRAYVASRRAGGDRAKVEQWLAGARVEQWLAGAKPFPAGMFDYVGTAWPDFEAFARAELRS